MKNEEIIELLNLGKYVIIKDEIGRSSSDVLKLQNETETVFLKIGDSNVYNLSKVLTYLSDKGVSVPKLLKYGEIEGRHYVLMTECVGKMTYELEPVLAVKVLAKTLKKLHSLPHPSNIVVKDVYYYENEMNKLDGRKLTKSDKEFIGRIKHLSAQDDLVFSHGDYCLPNILFENGETSLIDLDYAGVSFRYSDLLDCIWSLEYNFGTDKYTNLFLKEYGLESLNPIKVEEVKNIHRIMGIKGY